MATTKYISRGPHATVSGVDRSIAMHEDSPEPSAVRRMTEGATANLHKWKTSNQRAKNQFRPRVGKGGATSFQLRQYAEVTLGGGSLRKVVKLPEGEDENEWLAVNSRCLCVQARLLWVSQANRLFLAVVDFYNQINLIYGAITEFCSPQSCPEMKATDEYEYPIMDSLCAQLTTGQVRILVAG